MMGYHFVKNIKNLFGAREALIRRFPFLPCTATCARNSRDHSVSEQDNWFSSVERRRRSKPNFGISVRYIVLVVPGHVIRGKLREYCTYVISDLVSSYTRSRTMKPRLIIAYDKIICESLSA